jgi:hypothetical protein
MSAGALVAVGSPTSTPFILRIGPRMFQGSAPVPFPGDDGMVAQCTISETAEGSPNQMTFTIEDATGSIDFDFGEDVQMVDRRSGTERLLFGGHLVETVSRPRAGRGRILTCTALGYDAWLDWRVIVSWSSKTSKNGRVTKISSERAMVQQLINRFAPFLDAPASLITNQNTDMAVVSVKKVTLREALERVGQTATYADDDSTRNFYVDNARRLHWYRGSEGLTAPYRVGDGSYTRTVLGTTGLVSLWPLREATGTTVHDAMGYANGTLSGGYTQNVEGGIVNEPGLRAITFNGSTGYIRITDATNLNPGDTLSFECWFKRDGTGTRQYLWYGRNDGLYVRFSASDKIEAGKVNGSVFWTTDDSYTDDDWHHLVVTKNGTTRRIYVDGAAASSSGANSTLSAAGSLGSEIGASDTPGNFFDGSLQHVALYDVALSAATVEAHYHQGISLIPEDWEYTENAMEGREVVFVAGANPLGSGKVLFPELRRTAFGAPNRQPPREEIIERDDSEGTDKLRAYGRWFLRANRDPQQYGRFTITGFDGWRVGQTVYLTRTADGLDGYAAEIKSIETDVLFGSGVLRYDIQWGRKKWSGVRTTARDQRGKR